MKANFALKLSFTGIRLLHRAAGGWRFVGEVRLDDPDLDGALAALRRTALELEPSGLRTKLVLPDAQIRYLTIDTTHVPEADIKASVELALEGATPYPVRDLVFDVSPDGDRTHVAAVARETLKEAEAFALEHRFAPISLVGIPAGDGFLGEPYFGATDFARHILGPNDMVEPDGVAVVELGRADWPDGPVVEVVEDTPVAAEEPAGAGGELPQDAGDAGSSPEDTDDAPANPGDATGKQPVSAPSIEPRRVGFASRRRPGQESAPKLAGVTRRFDPVLPAEETSPPATDARPAPRGAARPIGEDEIPLDDDVPNPPPAVVAAFLSRRHATAPVHDPRQDAPGARPPEPSAPGTPDRPAAPAPADAVADSDRAEAAVGLPAAASSPDRTPPDIRPLQVPPPKSERERMTIFGARQTDSRPGAISGTPRAVGLALTAVLVVFLVGIAAWASIFIDEGITRFFAPRTAEAPLTADEVAPEPEQATDTAALPESPPEAEETAGQTPQSANVAPGSSSEERTDAGPEPFDRAEAEAQYAVTGIWTIPPEDPETLSSVNLDDLYVTSIDPPGEPVDAVALQPETEFERELAPLPLPSPAPAGTDFDLDDRGLVIPTPEGAMTPDGVMVRSGPPPVVPPEMPARTEDEPDQSDAFLRDDLLQFRPRTRPTDLVENTERQQLGGLSRTELAAYRPMERPETVKQAQEEDETPTAQAVASSVRPSGRPDNFSRIVARARERNLNPARQAAPQQTAVASARSVAPSIPSRSSVTREATVRNAINLRRINLLGVYGSPSDRRALVRLSNGRYKKVKVGDRIDGGRVSAIGDSELSYIKGSRNIVLRMPRT